MPLTVCLSVSHSESLRSELASRVLPRSSASLGLDCTAITSLTRLMSSSYGGRRKRLKTRVDWDLETGRGDSEGEVVTAGQGREPLIRRRLRDFAAERLGCQGRTMVVADELLLTTAVARAPRATLRYCAAPLAWEMRAARGPRDHEKAASTSRDFAKPSSFQIESARGNENPGYAVLRPAAAGRTETSASETMAAADTAPAGGTHATGDGVEARLLQRGGSRIGSAPSSGGQPLHSAPYFSLHHTTIAPLARHQQMHLRRREQELPHAKVRRRRRIDVILRRASNRLAVAEQPTLVQRCRRHELPSPGNDRQVSRSIEQALIDPCRMSGNGRSL